MARGRAEIVALVVDREIGELEDLVATVRPDYLQLHGRETPEAVRAIKAATGASRDQGARRRGPARSRRDRRL